MNKLVNGVQKELGLMDFTVERLSDRLGLLEFNSFTISKKSAKDISGMDVEYTVFAVKCTNSLNNRQITVQVTYDTQNKVALEEITKKSKTAVFEKCFIDFEDLVLGHYCSGQGSFANVAQTYKAERVKLLNEKDVEKILHIINGQKPIDVAKQAQEQNNK